MISRIYTQDKFVIAIKDCIRTFYLKEVFFKIASDSWLTEDIDAIPKEMLFDTREQAEACLLFIDLKHNLMLQKYYDIGVKPIKVLLYNSIE